MLFQAWFSALNVQKVELKLASILAVASACIVLLIVSWSFLTSTAQNNTFEEQTSSHQKVQTIERPTLAQKSTMTEKPTTLVKKKLKTTTKVISKKAEKRNLHQIVLGQGNYFVQVGAFNQAKLARLMLGKMKKKYHYAIIKRKGDKHAVWVGPVVTKADASNLQKHLQRQSNIQGFIVTKK